MSSAEDRAVLLLQRTSELMLECRAVATELQEPGSGTESPAEAAERIAYGVLVAALPTWTRFSRVRNPPICPSSNRQSSSWCRRNHQQRTGPPGRLWRRRIPCGGDKPISSNEVSLTFRRS
jgi:hypothetical protein